MARVELVGLSKAWGRAVAVDGIDLAIDEGEFLAVLGPSGCGKSTTLMMLAGIYQPTGGEIRFDGAVVNAVEARDRNVGIVFQSYALYPNMTALQNILFPLRFQKAPDAEARAREMADLVQISELLDRRPAQLSGGQQQRVALARALVKRPNLLLLDEPLSNLDATLRLTMRAEIKRITRDLGVTTILVTHDQIEATTMADRVVCMNRGGIEQVGLADDLYHRPATTFVAGFIGSPPMNLLTVDGRGLVEWSAPLPPGTLLGIRPEKLAVAAAGLPAEVDTVEPMGRETLYRAQTPLGPVLFLEPGDRARHRPGDRLHLAFRSADTLVFGPEGRRLPDVHAVLKEPPDA